MKKYHIGAGMFGIYAGTLKYEGEWKDKSDCTDEAISAVRDYMIDNCLGGFDCSKANNGGYEWKLKDGRTVELRVIIKE